MLSNPVVDAMMHRASIRKYTDQEPTNDVLETLVRAGQQAPFAGQLGSLLLSRDRKTNPFNAPLLFTACADLHRMERVMARRSWTMAASDPAMFMFAVQDAAYLIQNLVIAAESLGMGSCYLGAAPFAAKRIAEQYKLPPRVFPIVQMTVGYPAESPQPRPRYPLSVSLFEDAYPELTDEIIDDAMAVMDAGYLDQDYYRSAGALIPLAEGRAETHTYDTYSWTEHMCRKWGQWLKDPKSLLEPLEACGFDMSPNPKR